ncbi:DUF655 domain-containing protein [Thermofilum pendens]|uniref:Nucleotide binding protein n=1 Tax=Thermofilum pendens (strain DSM 2475 / Hrk 5) TaxID=368408 RepID=A1RX32_THEPD|nr:DUF655 domain-containing protein [Thermofilum pendens]ABL77762.1 putative nucleotide binding protein [Thermofilum pendens Hrk 5]
MFRGDYQRKPYRPLDENLVVLDMLPYGDAVRGIKYPLVQTIGEYRFLLVELKSTTPQAPSLKPLDRISSEYLREARLLSFARYLTYDELSATAKANLVEAVTAIVKVQEKRFVDFFNNAQPLSKKAHTLELLKGIGKRTLWKILDERRRKPFESFEDIKARADIDPVELIVERILEELKEPQTIYIFVNPPYGPVARSGRREGFREYRY